MQLGCFFLGEGKAGCEEGEVSWALHACAFLWLSSGASLSPWGQALPGVAAPEAAVTGQHQVSHWLQVSEFNWERARFPTGDGIYKMYWLLDT